MAAVCVATMDSAPLTRSRALRLPGAARAAPAGAEAARDEASTPCAKRRRTETPSASAPRVSATEEQEIIKEGAQPQQYPLVGRERECKALDDFFARSLTAPADGSRAPGGSIYVSGGPGAGKTCAVRAAAAVWQRSSAGTVILEVNCMELSQRSPAGLLQRVAALARARLGPGLPGRAAPLPAAGPKLLAAVAELLAALGRSVVIVADEVDQLVARRPARNAPPGSGLEAVLALPRVASAPAVALVAVANAVDLLERSAEAATSRGGCESLLFETYSAEQLRTIVRSRFGLEGAAGAAAAKALGPVAVELRIRQVAKQSGDCRQIVRLCEQALMEAAAEAEEAERRNSEAAVGMPVPSTPTRPSAGAAAAATPATPCKRPRTVGGARSDPLAAVGQLPLEQQVLLCVLSAAGGEAMKVLDVCARYKDSCKHLHRATLGKEEVNCALQALEQRGLLSLRTVRRPGAGGRGRAAAGAARSASDAVVELAVSRKAVQETIASVNPTLQRCVQ